MQIHIDEEALNLLDEYCKYRPSEPQYIVETAIRPWYTLAAKKWCEFPNLIPNLPKIPETKTTAVNIAKSHAREYIKTLNSLNKKLGKEINPVSLTSWLVKIYCKGYIERMAKKYKPDFGKLKRI